MAPLAGRSPTPQSIASEDPDTASARKELRQTAISEKPTLFAMAASQDDAVDPAAPSDDAPSTADSSGKATTPERDAREDAAKDQMASPKKKRAHDEVDQPKGTETGADNDGDVSPIGANGSASLDRADRSEPEKKRPRDVSSEIKVNSSIEKKGESATNKAPAKDGNHTTLSAFQSSGMSSFASQSSPFLQAGAGQTLSSFASPSATKSPFALSSSTTKSIFSGGTSSSKVAASPFGQITSTTFGGFGSGAGGPRLTTFGTPGELLKGNKPAKPFGAPVSDNEDRGDDSEDSNASENDKDDPENQGTEEDKAAESEDKKKTKLQRVVVDDGEADEATLLQVRARLYSLDKTSNSWKERGAGNLKINVPMECIKTDFSAGPLSGTFDGSALTKANSKVVRLIMRQDSTHRVILNTAIIPVMEFREKSSLKATYILFSAIEDDGGAVSIQVRMNAANAKSFLSEVESVQRRLRSV